MGTTQGGLSYPNSPDATLPPLSIQTLAEQWDAFVPRVIRTTGAFIQYPPSFAPLPDPDLKVTLPPGVWRVVAALSFSAPTLNRDVEVNWSLAAGASMLSRWCTGPAVAASDTASQLFVHQPLSGFATLRSYGVPVAVGNYIRDELLVQVTGGSRLVQLQWTYLNSPVEGDPAGEFIRGATSNLKVRKMVAAPPGFMP